MVSEIPMPRKSIARDATVATFRRAKKRLLAVSMHGMSFTLVTK